MGPRESKMLHELFVRVVAERIARPPARPLIDAFRLLSHLASVLERLPPAAAADSIPAARPFVRRAGARARRSPVLPDIDLACLMTFSCACAVKMCSCGDKPSQIVVLGTARAESCGEKPSEAQIVCGLRLSTCPTSRLVFGMKYSLGSTAALQQPLHPRDDAVGGGRSLSGACPAAER